MGGPTEQGYGGGHWEPAPGSEDQAPEGSFFPAFVYRPYT